MKATEDAFSRYHPLVNFSFFGVVLFVTMFFRHPAIQAISLLSAFRYFLYLRGGRAARKGILLVLPLVLVATLVNITFNHQGATILGYLPGGNPLTLESIVSAAVSSVTVVAVIVWFSCFSAVMTSDKFVYLFGRILPALSLLLSMTLRFIPLYRSRYKDVSEVQLVHLKAKGRLRRLRAMVASVSIVMTWALENAIETADSMKSRGYGLPGRSAFSIYSLHGKDFNALMFQCFAVFSFFSAAFVGTFYWRFYPTIRWANITPFGVYQLAVFFILCHLPLVTNFLEDRAWKRHVSSID